MLKIAVLVSGGGTNLEAIFDAVDAGRIKNGKVEVVIASKPGVYALERAKNHGVDQQVDSRRDCASAEDFDARILQILTQRQVDLVVLAGFLSVLGEKVIKAYENRIINVHPALIPSFCGKGFYGLHVHEKVLEYGVKLTGATVHFVNEIADGGAIILQKAVAVCDDDTPETLQKRVMDQAEWELLPQAINLFCQGKLHIKGRRVSIDR